MLIINSDQLLQDPILNPGDEAYFEGTAKGKLLLKKCLDCGKVHHYPRAICPFCWSDKLEWQEASGNAEIYSFSTTHRGEGAPYCIAYVTLEEGPKILTNIVDENLEKIQIGLKVKLAFQKTVNNFFMPVFIKK